MSKDPAILFYTGDFLTGTDYFTDEETGQYIRLLCHQHQHGHLNEDFLSRKYPKGVFPEVRKKFKIDSSGRIYQERMEIEINRRLKYSESRRQNIAKYWNKNDKPLSGKKIDSIHMNNHMMIHMETRTRNENRNEIKDKKPIPEHLKEIMSAFIEMRKKIRKPATEAAIQLIIKKLQRWYPDNPKLQIKCVENSVESSWQGVFELKGNDLPVSGMLKSPEEKHASVLSGGNIHRD